MKSASPSRGLFAPFAARFRDLVVTWEFMGSNGLLAVQAIVRHGTNARPNHEDENNRPISFHKWWRIGGNPPHLED
ncbi:hypothetical protein [Paracoccus sp. (in: a-proteobacteria)]|uniref:hypothetical protein n=1 Tax=Paracoccus sp. TaxID=267 RepID=UPI00396C67A1